ncbi:MAG: hypothetical protein AB1779_10685, partial [Candidatus Thermoplasmatota archaeon]
RYDYDYVTGSDYDNQDFNDLVASWWSSYFMQTASESAGTSSSVLGSYGMVAGVSDFSFNTVLDTPKDRIKFTTRFFEQHTGTSIFGRKINYGVDIIGFMEWERDSKRLGDIETGKGGSFYWKTVNGLMITDMMIAEKLYHQNKERLANDLEIKWIDFIKNPSQKTLWAAHNASILTHSKLLIDKGALVKEKPAEQAFIYSVLYRVTGTQLINFPTSMGLIGILIDERSPAGYPKRYPATWEDAAVYPHWGLLPGEKKAWRDLFEK